jgi:cardiolipin synthase
VPQRRAPSAARGWLLLIFFLPYAGALLYALIGRAFLPKRRVAMQAQIGEAIGKVLPAPEPARAAGGPLAPAARLAARLSEFAVVEGNRFELLPLYDAALDRLVAEIDDATRTSTCCTTSSRATMRARGWPRRSSAPPPVASPCAC